VKGAEAEGGSAGHGAPGEWTGYPVCGPVRGGPERKGRVYVGDLQEWQEDGWEKGEAKNVSGRVEKAR
jgi:hypothetical protein